MADKSALPKPNNVQLTAFIKTEGGAITFQDENGKPYTGKQITKSADGNTNVMTYKNGQLVSRISVTPQGKAYRYTSPTEYTEIKNPYATSTSSATPTPKATPTPSATPKASSTPTVATTPTPAPSVTPSAGNNLPTFDLGTTGDGNVDSKYTVDVGFGLKDKAGNPLMLSPVKIGPYIISLAGTDPAAYKKVKSAIGLLTGRKTMDPNYVGGYVQKLAQNIMASSDILARTGSLEDYIGKATQGTTAGETKAPPQSYVSSPTQAKSDINAIFKTELGRDATDKEVTALTSILNDAQKKNPSTYINGVTYGGLDKAQFLTDLINSGKYEAKPTAYPKILGNLATEAAEVKATGLAKKAGTEAAQTLSDKQAILATAMLNGVKLNDDEVNGYLEAIKGGKNVASIQQDIRASQALGMPDNIKKFIEAGTDLNTIYAPYKRIMGSSLDIDPNTIDLNDPTLRMAIGPDKEMSLYDYQKSIRKDKRWQYSQEANDEVSAMINQVKRDFGFQG
jgi:hypothetical protein